MENRDICIVQATYHLCWIHSSV